MKSSRCYDVIIVGGGPAGSTCARECSKRGLRTLVLEKSKFPRDKPCGGALSEQAMSYLDFEMPSELIEKECFGARVHFKGHMIEVKKEDRIAVLVSRDKFDDFLLNKALETGCDCCFGERVIEINRKKGYIEVVTEKTRYEGNYIVGADGINSCIARYVRPPIPKDEKAFSLVASVPASNDEIDKRLDNIIDIHFGVIYQGYGWLFPHNGYYSVGIAGLASVIKNPKEALLDFANALGIKVRESRGHYIPAGGIRRKIVNDRVILVGDAAGFVDPFYGEGLAYAILSGKLASNALAECNASSDCNFSKYETECDNKIVKDLRYAWYLSKMLHKFPNLFLRLFADNKRVLAKYLEVPSCRLEYRQFFVWLLERSPFYIAASYLKL